MRIAVVDDEKAELDLIYKTLCAVSINPNEKNATHCFTSGIEFIRQLKRETFDLLILDWHIPDFNGEDILKWMRHYRETIIPTIVLTSFNDEASAVQALELGASDYVIKPYRQNELIARIRRAVVTAPINPITNHVNEVSYEDVKFKQASRVVVLNSQAIELTELEFNLAEFLFKNLNKAVSRNHIIDEVWKWQTPDLASRSLDVHVFRVRKKLNLTAEFGWILSSVYGYGYRLERTNATLD